MQRHSRLPRRASAATMALYNDKDTPGRLGAFRSTKGAALGSSYRTGTCFVRRGQMSPIMFSSACGRKSQNNSRTENTVVKSRAATGIAYGRTAIASHSALLEFIRRKSRVPRRLDQREEEFVRHLPALFYPLPSLGKYPQLYIKCYIESDTLYFILCFN